MTKEKESVKFTFIGAGKAAPEVVTAFGKTFELRGDAVEITDPTAIEKLSNNPSFKRVGEKVKEGEGSQPSDEEAELLRLKPAELAARYKEAGFNGKASKEDMIEGILSKNATK